ncbi:N-acetyltransferase [Malaciobacter molluscorum LMG 25693]|uniref:Acetyltransferase n=1 Tax=Malaciobacter molluscorum LMG 25693 TaxID=870501 RepID=A0A2G1DKY4_9BACT|nr:N-acetyltransferase [Malaciobacter molluscorum]AXX92715.1 acetyltransferase [Malaciobacter molluscorum LMG 25693]PHO19131.1 N-acetyltransferase [Malaciobacter molluscorum LMG 25693]RXJ97445.1 N-acetyltransferase [Malaciobacter molluscorum]
MIRKANKQDINKIVDIWLEVSIIAHDFISSSFWESQVQNMKDIYIPNSLTYVIEYDSQIVGFYSLYKDTLAALFIKSQYQSKGLGKKLLDDAKSKNNTLFLTVYKKNNKACNFYLSNGFNIIKEHIDSNTNQEELEMKFEKIK